MFQRIVNPLSRVSMYAKPEYVNRKFSIQAVRQFRLPAAWHCGLKSISLS